MAKITVNAQCESCGGSGLYQGFAEAPGYPVVCLTCSGTGCQQITFTQYEGRKIKRGIKGVQVSRGTFIATGVGGTGPTMTYKEFQEKYPEPKV